MIESDYKVSVIIPMYNVESYLHQSISSVFSQTLDEIQVILVDDNSKDKTVEIAEFYEAKHPNITLLRQYQNKGPGAARNLAIQHASGDYVFFMDADDLIDEFTLEKLYNAALEKDSDLVYGAIKRFNQHGVIEGSVFEQHPILGMQGFKDLNNYPELFYLIYACGKLYDRKLLEGVSFSEDTMIGEDQPFTIHAYLKAKKIYCVTDIVYYYRTRDSSDYSLTQSLHISAPIHCTNLINMVSKVKTHLDTFCDDDRLKDLLFEEYLNRVLDYDIIGYLGRSLQHNNGNTQEVIFDILRQWITSLDHNLVKNVRGFLLLASKLSKDLLVLIKPEAMDGLLRLLRSIESRIKETNIPDTERSTCRFILNDGSIINVFKNDYLMHKIKNSNDYYEKKELQRFIKYIPKQSIIYDIGANIGNHSLYFSKYAYPQKVYSFEPIPYVADILKLNMKDNKVENVEVFNVAVSDRQAFGTMKMMEGNLGGSQLSFNDHGNIKIVRLDDLGLAYPNFVKIDVESSELEVLKGMEGIINNSSPIIWIEIHDTNLIRVNNYLNSIGYEMVERIREKDYANYIFIRA